jgi:hypothetical protein
LPISYELAVIIGRDVESQSSCQENLSSRGLQEVGPTNDFGDLHGSVIDCNGQLIGRYIVATPNDEISKVPAGFKSLGSEIAILEAYYFAIRNTEAPIYTGRTFELQRIGT